MERSVRDEDTSIFIYITSSICISRNVCISVKFHTNRVEIGWPSIRIGVPQDWILGPFNCYFLVILSYCINTYNNKNKITLLNSCTKKRTSCICYILSFYEKINNKKVGVVGKVSLILKQSVSLK